MDYTTLQILTLLNGKKTALSSEGIKTVEILKDNVEITFAFADVMSEADVLLYRVAIEPHTQEFPTSILEKIWPVKEKAEAEYADVVVEEAEEVVLPKKQKAK